MDSAKFEAIKEILRRNSAQQVLMNWPEKAPIFDAAFEDGERFLRHELTRDLTAFELSVLEGCPPSAQQGNSRDSQQISVRADGGIDGYWFNERSLIELPDGKFSVEIHGRRTYAVDSSDEPERFRDVVGTWKIHFLIDSATRRAELLEIGQVTFADADSEF